MQADELMYMSRSLPAFPPTLAPIQQCLADVQLAMRASGALLDLCAAYSDAVASRCPSAQAESQSRSALAPPSRVAPPTPSYQLPRQQTAEVRALVAFVQQSPALVERACLWLPGLRPPRES